MVKRMAIEYWCFYHAYGRKVEKLSDQELGRLVRALTRYSETGETQELTGRESIAFDFIADDIDRAKERYAAQCAQNQNNGSKGGRPKKPTETEKTEPVFEKPTETEKTQEKEKTKTKTKTKREIDNSLSLKFERFWAAYPRHDNKAQAEKAFNKLNPDDNLLATMLSAIEKQKRSSQWQNKQYIPQGSTWLNNRRWEDESDAVCGTDERVSEAFDFDKFTV